MARPNRHKPPTQRAFQQEILCEANGEYWERATALWNWAVLAWRDGETVEAVQSARKSLRLWAKFPNRLGIARCLEVLAWAAAAEADPERSAVILGATETAWRDAGATLFLDLTEFRRCCEASVRRALGDRASAAAARRGRNMTLTDLLAYALGEQAKVVSSSLAERAVLTVGRVRLPNLSRRV
jgi:hypothetical protein